MTKPPDRPPSVVALEEVYGEPSTSAFGGAVFWQPRAADQDLGDVALATYRHFVGELWGRYGEDAWMAPWREVHTRPAGAPADVLAELDTIQDAEARRAVPPRHDEIVVSGSEPRPAPTSPERNG